MGSVGFCGRFFLVWQILRNVSETTKATEPLVWGTDQARESISKTEARVSDC